MYDRSSFRITETEVLCLVGSESRGGNGGPGSVAVGSRPTNVARGLTRGTKMRTGMFRQTVSRHS